MSFLFDTLVWKDRNGYVPALARTWSYDSKKTAYYFTLTEGILWHDGKPFTARDAAFTFRYIRQHPYPWVNSDIIKKARRSTIFTL
jgi:peptide/nickel transport system substrate-binding protein